MLKRRPQYGLRTLLAGMTWAALIIAVCVGQQQAASRQRQKIEQLKAAGVLPLTVINGRPIPPRIAPAPAPPSQTP